MKLFVAILIAAGIIGGLVGSELTDDGFSWTGATIGFLGTGAAIFSLGAFVAAQDRRRKRDLPPEIRDVFGRMFSEYLPAAAKATARKVAAGEQLSPTEATLHNSILYQMAQLRTEDLAIRARGEVPERRLIPHDSLKRDVATAAYKKDLAAAVAHVNAMAWTQAQKQKQFEELRRDFSKQMDRIKRLTPDELSGLIARMEQTRIDVKELEAQVRKEHSWYSIVGPL